VYSIGRQQVHFYFHKLRPRIIYSGGTFTKRVCLVSTCVPGDTMHLFRETFLLFSLNLLDALLTLVWVRTGTATEANHIMAALLEIGDYPFFMAKLAMGTITAVVILKYGYLKIAKPLVSFALVVYIGLMGVHLMTGLVAAGLVSHDFLQNAEEWSTSIFAFIN
jgi:hypothetical protein